MSAEPASWDAQVRRWWTRFAIALFLLIPLDLLTTLAAVSQHGLAVEANPIMQWLLRRGLVAVTLANLAAVCVAVALFHAAVERFRRTPPAHRRRVVRAVNAWLGVLLLAGCALVANNLLTVV